MPRFSIIVPVYNKEKALKRCIDSVLEQGFDDWELLLLDDGSTDKSYFVAQSFSDPRIRLSHHANIGVSATRNQGIRQALGEFVLFLDADDYWSADYLRPLDASIDACPADIYLTGLTKVGIDGTPAELLFPFEGLLPKETVLKSFYEIQRSTHLYGYVANKVLRKSFLDKEGLWFNETMALAEDLDFYLRCYDRCRTFCFIKNAGYNYVAYGEGTSLFRKDIDFFSLIDLQRRLKVFCGGYMTTDDESSYLKTIGSWAKSAVMDIRPGKIQSLPETLQRIRQDPELDSLCHFRGPTVWLMLKVLARQIYLRLAQWYLRQCKK